MSSRADRAAQALLVVGAVLRISQYLYNRPLWLDEASLALNIVGRTFAGLTERLDYVQSAPFGFLFIEKASTLAFGTSELALRLFPLLAGIAALWVFFAVARQLLPPRATLCAVALFALFDPLIYFSSETKPYSSDVLGALALTWIALEMRRRAFDTRSLVTAALGGVAAMWLSFPAVFVLAGIGLTLVVSETMARRWRSVRALIGVGAVWLVSFAVLYAVSLATVTDMAAFYTFWRDRFIPISVNPSGRHWVGRLVMDLRAAPVLVAGAFALIGVRVLARSSPQRASMLVLPGLATLAAGALHQYPFYGRLVLFLAPAAIIAASAGMVAVAEWLEARRRRTGTILLLSLFLYPAGLATYRLLVPRVREDLRLPLEWMRQRWQPGDEVYVYAGARRQEHGTTRSGRWRRRARSFRGFHPDDTAHGTSLSSIASPAGHACGSCSRTSMRMRTVTSATSSWSYLDRRGRRLGDSESVDASVHLYDLSIR